MLLLLSGDNSFRNTIRVSNDLDPDQDRLVLGNADRRKVTISYQAIGIAPITQLRMCIITRNVSIGHGCPRYRQIHINRELSLKKGNNS